MKGSSDSGFGGQQYTERSGRGKDTSQVVKLGERAFFVFFSPSTSWCCGGISPTDIPRIMFLISLLKKKKNQLCGE